MGGAERIIAEKANYLTKHFGYNVYFINLFQDNDTSNIYLLSDSIHQINLGIPYHIQYRYKYPKRLFIKLKILYDMRKKLSYHINLIKPNIVIGVSYSQADLVCSIPCNAKKIIESHEPRSLIISNIYCGTFISKLYAKWIYIRRIEKKADMIVTLTKEDKAQWEKAKRVEVIPNFSSMRISINAHFSDWQLDIFGDGLLKDQLTLLINKNNVKNLFLRGATQDISIEYANSSICVITSYFEGFSLVILEAMKHGVPCVAFDCPNGPRNIIEDGRNGFLVEDGNNSLFIERLCSLMENSHLRQQFSEAAKIRANDFNIDIIMGQWKALFESFK